MIQKISILVCYFNSEKYIYRALKSLLNQGNVFIELILVDNNSSDRSFEIVNSFIKEEINSKLGHLFTVYCLKERRQGLAYARNAGFGLVSSDYVYILDSDNQLVPGVLPSVVKLISNINADCYFLKNKTITGSELAYGDNFEKFWDINDFFAYNSELTPIFSKNFIRNHRYFEAAGVTSELPILLYLKLFKYNYSLYATSLYGQIYDNGVEEHVRISTASIFSRRSYAGLVQRHQTLKEFGKILPLRTKFKYFFEFCVFRLLCFYLGYNVEGFTLKFFFSKSQL